MLRIGHLQLDGGSIFYIAPPVNGTAGWLGGACALSGRGLGCSRMHYHTFACSAMPSVERTTASAGEVVVAHPSPAPGTVDGMSGDLGEKGRVWLGQELGRVP